MYMNTQTHIHTYIYTYRAEGGATMVHCYASLSRSVAFVLAYMMKSQKVSAAEAARMMKAKWDAVWPADAFVHQLLEYERELAGLPPLPK